MSKLSSFTFFCCAVFALSGLFSQRISYAQKDFASQVREEPQSKEELQATDKQEDTLPLQPEQSNASSATGEENKTTAESSAPTDQEIQTSKEKSQQNVFIPWTLEMGSWIWVRKNPLQIFKAEGFFNPVKAHRYDRTMRRHMRLIDFMFRAVRNYQSWT